MTRQQNSYIFTSRIDVDLVQQVGTDASVVSAARVSTQGAEATSATSSPRTSPSGSPSRGDTTSVPDSRTPSPCGPTSPHGSTDRPTPTPGGPMGEQQPGITCHGTCRRCHEHKALVAHGSMCQDCLDAIEGLPQWQHVTPTIRVDIGRYGREVDDEEIAYLLRMGGIDAEIVEAGRG